QIHGSVPPLKPDAQATGDGARARIQVVVDTVQPRGRINTAVPGDGERVLYRGVEAQRLAPIREVVGERDVVHAEERTLLQVVVRAHAGGIAARGDRVGQAHVLAFHGLPVLVLLLAHEE